ncbi:MAG TPA: transcriptional regulator [Syntrophothermus lipocalidus]|uniref:Regulatory protein, FmdB family n=1 Tax=Syntrophothermus lipocalidus (strain DSM 12680 / TGB-C1) TaxID=643648 RepID=D7CL48_SYNLT|nr:FmdB family zinc ribbon protein [Syntrophothermus lipocalidus]ADI01433.1 regulatory protein, FmdB family [Syntrophothermus lipocalidus DSM 12680]HHV76066.1 transcriptional regulator [Syntrophothermus lipocalidus]
MPVYDYKCQHCGKFEIVQRITAPPLEECPTCGGKVERLISRNVGIVFKGPGFYTTDSREKDRLRELNRERQKDNQALLDGDVGGFVKQSDETDKRIAEMG